MTKVAISGYYGFKNFGDEAILTLLVNHLKSINSDITVFSSDAEYTQKKLHVNAINSFNIKQVFNILKNTDILISGGGSLLQDATSLKSLIYYSFLIFIALLFRKKVIIFAQGIGPLNNFLSGFLVINLLKNCSLVTVRDEKSQQFLNKYNIKSILMPDPIFSLNIKPVKKTDVIGIQLRDCKSISDNFLNNLADKIIENYIKNPLEIISLHSDFDLKISEKFNDILKSKSQIINSIIVNNLSVSEIIDRISSYDTLIAMRFHAILIALKTGVKTMAINYDIKVEKLANEFDIPCLELNKDSDINKEFSILKNEVTSRNVEIASEKNFDWSIFDKLIMP